MLPINFYSQYFHLFCVVCRVADRLVATYVLRVKHDDKEYTLKFPGTKTVREVKNDIYSLTDIPFRYQVGFKDSLTFFLNYMVAVHSVLERAKYH